LRTGLASDCVELTINSQTKLMEATRPVSGGNAMATVVIEHTRPQMATVRGKTMEPAQRNPSRQGNIVPVTVNLDPVPPAVTLVERVKAEAAGVRLEDAEIVISGGRGLKGPDDFHAVLTPCAKVLGAAVGACPRGAAEGGGACPSRGGGGGRVCS